MAGSVNIEDLDFSILPSLVFKRGKSGKPALRNLELCHVWGHNTNKEVRGAILDLGYQITMNRKLPWICSAALTQCLFEPMDNITKNKLSAALDSALSSNASCSLDYEEGRVLFIEMGDSNNIVLFGLGITGMLPYFYEFHKPYESFAHTKSGMRTFIITIDTSRDTGDD